jgi:hypothetical protein
VKSVGRMMLTGENQNTASATFFIISIIFCNSILPCYISQLRKCCEMLCGGGGGGVRQKSLVSFSDFEGY